MKTADIVRKYLSNRRDTVLLIENEDDLVAYEGVVYNTANNLLVGFMQSDLPAYKFDHFVPGVPSLTLGIAQFALYQATKEQNRVADVIEGRLPAPSGVPARLMDRAERLFTNPLYQLFPAAASKIGTLRRVIEQCGYPLLVNYTGGFMPYKAKDIEILRVYDAPLRDGTPRDSIRHGTRWIVLENDYVLPVESRDFLTRTDPNFSVIFNLRGHSERELKQRLAEFKKAGGQTVFVYTTGLDVPQIYEYLDVVQACGLRRVQFHFTGGTNAAIKECLRKYQDSLAITVLKSLA